MTKLKTIIDPNPNDYFILDEVAKLLYTTKAGLTIISRRKKIQPIRLRDLNFTTIDKKKAFVEAKSLLNRKKLLSGNTRMLNKEQKNKLFDILLNSSVPVKVIDPNPSDYFNTTHIQTLLKSINQPCAMTFNQLDIPYITTDEIRFSTPERRADFLKQLTRNYKTGLYSNLFVHKIDFTFATGIQPVESGIPKEKKGISLKNFDQYWQLTADNKKKLLSQKTVSHSETPSVLDQLEQTFGKDWKYFDLIKKELKIKEINLMNLTREQLIEKLAEYQA